jgi:type II secretion system protein N
MKKGLQTAAFAGYGIFLAVGLLYAMFPSEAYMAHMEASVQRVDPRMEVFAEQVRPAFPLGLRFLGLRLALADRPKAPVFDAEALRVIRSVASLLTERSEYRFDARAYGGTVTGRATLADDEFRGPVTADVRMHGLRLQDHPLLRIPALRSLSGLLGGSISFAGARERWMEGEGEARLTVSGAALTLAEPVWNIQAIHIDEGRVELSLRGRVLTLSRAEMYGREVQGNISGTIQLADSPEKSRLNLKGSVRPFPSVSKLVGGLLGEALAEKLGRKSGVSFVIHGTVEAPDVRVL